MSSRRVLLISEQFEPAIGATAQLMSDLAQGLNDRSWNVTVLTSTPGRSKASTASHPQVVRLGHISTGKAKRAGVGQKALGGVLFFWSSLLWVLLKGRDGDLVFIVSNPPFIGLLGPLLAGLRRLNYIFLFQDLFPRTAVISGILPATGPITGSWHWLMGTVCRQSVATIVLSDSMRQRLLRDCGQALPLQVIHNWAVEQAKPTPRAQNLFAAEHGFQESFTVQYSGNFGRLHDLLTLLEAARILKPHPVQFVFIGGGVKQSQIDLYREEYALENVLRLPYQPRGKLADSLGACDLAAIGLVPGGEDTMAPCKFYGILASGRGVVLVARRTCDLAQIVLNEGIGVVVEPGESEALAEELLQLSKNPDRVQTMGDRAQSLYTARFGRERSVTAYAGLLEQIR